MYRIKEIKARIKFLRVELLMKKYSSGWIIIPFENEIRELEIELRELNK